MPETKRTASGVLGGIAGLVGLSVAAGVLVTATITPAIAVSGAAASSAITMFDNLPSILEIEKLQLPTTLYYKDPDSGTDVELTQFYDQNRSPVGFDEVNPVMYDAILSSEDPRYYQHGGIDLIGTTRALVQNARGGGETQGGSSISQQYVKNILIQKCEADAESAEQLSNCFTEATQAQGTDGYQRKLQEMRYSIALEQKYSKNEILLGYLNIANFGGTTYGVDAAAKYYFGVSARDLNLAQAATLAGIVQNPNTYRIDRPGGTGADANGVPLNAAPDGVVESVGGQIATLDNLLAAGEITQEEYLAAADGYTMTKGRQLYVLSRMLDDGKITQEQYREAVVAPLTPSITPAKTGCSAAAGMAYFCQYVKYVIRNDEAFGATPEDRQKALQRGGLSIYTTMDPRVQIPSQNTMVEYAPSSVENMKFGATSVSLEATTGRVLAIAQNTVFSEDADVLRADPNYSAVVYAGNLKNGGSIGFSAGSTFKIFTLIDWLEQGKSLNQVINGRDRVIPRITNSCTGDWVNSAGWKPGNFGGGGGYSGTPLTFTTQSLNSGYLAMAAELDLCDIAKVATKMGVTFGDGTPLTMPYGTNVIGSDNVSPMAMAEAFATVANNGIYCQPKVIDRIVDPDGVEITPPASTCTQVMTPEVAATAAFALETVMDGGGTGSQGNARDGTPVLGKTGTHQEWQTWLVQSSTNVSTAVWVGNVEGAENVFRRWAGDYSLADLRYVISRQIQEAANAVYGGNDFPGPDSDLTRRVLTELPNVVGMGIDDASRTLQNAGFDTVVGEPVDSSEAAGVVASQNPGAGMVAGGTTVTLNASNGQGLGVPAVSGELNTVVSALRGAGFGNVRPGSCTVDENAAAGVKTATGTTPATGEVVNRNSAISVNYSAKKCP